MSGPGDWCCADPELCTHHDRASVAPTTPRHRDDRHQDSCSLACEAGQEGAGTCSTYVGTHRAEPTS